VIWAIVFFCFVRGGWRQVGSAVVVYDQCERASQLGKDNEIMIEYQRMGIKSVPTVGEEF
jgi:hypothetical protein